MYPDIKIYPKSKVTVIFLCTFLLFSPLVSAFDLNEVFGSWWGKLTGKVTIDSTGTLAAYNYTAGDREVYVTYTTGSQSENHKIRFSNFYNNYGVNVTTIEVWEGGSWTTKCIDRRPSDSCSVGSATLTITSISPHPDRTVTVRGSSGVVFSSQTSPPQKDPPPTTGCVDTDGGKSELVYGVVTSGKDRLNSADVCEGGAPTSSRLLEKFCNPDGSEGSLVISCQNGCVDGVCKKTSGNDATTNIFICSESESEKDYFAKGPQVKHGWKSGDNPSAFSDDYCTSTNVMKEVWCEKGYYNEYDYICQNGCADGACRPETRQEAGCVDFDAHLGLQQYNAASNATSSTESVLDVCSTPKTLIEQTCVNGKPTPQTYNCLNGCKEGSCLSESESPQQQSQQELEDKGTGVLISIEDSEGKLLTGKVYFYDESWILNEKKETVNGAAQFAISQSEERREYIIAATAPGHYNETFKISLKKDERYETRIKLTKCVCNEGNCPLQEIICSQPPKEILKILEVEPYVHEQSNILPLRIRIKMSEDLDGVFDGGVLIRHAEKGIVGAGNIHCGNLNSKVTIDDCISYQSGTLSLFEGEEEYQIEIQGYAQTKRGYKRVNMDFTQPLKLSCAGEDCIPTGGYAINPLKIEGYDSTKSYPLGTIFLISQSLYVPSPQEKINNMRLKISTGDSILRDEIMQCRTHKSTRGLGNEVSCYYTWRIDNIQDGKKTYLFQTAATVNEGKVLEGKAEITIKFEPLGGDADCKELIPGHNKPDAERANIVFLGFGYDATIDHIVCKTAVESYCQSKGYAGVVEETIKYDANQATFYCKVADNKGAGATATYADLQTLDKRCSLESQDSLTTFMAMASRLVDVDGKEKGLFSVEPFKSHKEKFNIWYVDNVPSFSEVDCPIMPDSDGSQSSLLSHCTSKQRLESACKVSNKYLIKVIDGIFRSSAGYDGVLLSASIRDYSSYKHAPGISVHEFGHAFGRLEDEYLVGFRKNSYLGRDAEKSNCYLPEQDSINSCMENGPWKSLVGNGCGKNSIIDCNKESDNNYENEVACFKGCGDEHSYRSTFNSIMRNHYKANPFSFGPWNEKLLKEELDKFSGV